jgi:hypothetical protein
MQISRVRARLVALAILAAAASALAACGSRTGLFADEIQGDALDAATDAPVDARDSGRDTGTDALPTIDSATAPDVVKNDCPDAAATVIYTVTEDNELLAFDPAAASFRMVGILSCPAPASTSPFSMAVDRRGAAWVLFNDGNLYRTSAATASCSKTTFVPNQANFNTFGMGFATNDIGPTETLYVAGDGQGTSATGLGSIDTTSYALTSIHDFSPPIDRAELTGTGDGRLFAFYTKAGGVGSWVGQLDKKTAKIVAENALPTVEQGRGWAFAFWGGDFYLFTSPEGAGSRVTRFRPSNNSVVNVAGYPSIIVGAGVSTCAPQ